MMGVALVIILLVSVAIFSLSKLKTAPLASSFPVADIQPLATPRSVPDLAGKNIELRAEQLLGHWTLLSFWSANCQPCLEELPLLDQLNQSWQGPELQIVTVLSEGLDQGKKFLSESGIELTTYFDSDERLSRIFDVKSFPQHFLISPSGKILWEGNRAFQWSETKTHDQLIKLMEQVAPEPAPGPEE